MLQRNSIYGLHEGRDEEFGCQSLDGRESCSWRNAKPCYRKTDKRVQGNPCIEITEATKVNFCY